MEAISIGYIITVVTFLLFSNFNQRLSEVIILILNSHEHILNQFHVYR